ncbi:hypothetical protein V8C40DRAFT_244357 [Trichoderma camerunense]
MAMGSICDFAGRLSKIAVINRVNEANSTCKRGGLWGFLFLFFFSLLRLLVAQWHSVDEKLPTLCTSMCVCIDGLGLFVWLRVSQNIMRRYYLPSIGRYM